MKIRKTCARTLLAAALFAAAFSGTSQAGESGKADCDLQIEKVEITVPGLQEERTLLWVSDMHIVSYPEDPEVLPEKEEAVSERRDLLQSKDGIPSALLWEDLSGRIDSFGADYVVFGADMVDYMSAANLDALGRGLEKVKTPWMYLRADHDYGRWYVDMGVKKMRSLHREIAAQEKVWVQRFDSFTLAGLDNTTSAISAEALETIREIFGEGKPVILCMHVPVDQRGKERGSQGSLARLSEEGWGGRVLCWGAEDAYSASPGSTMGELTDLIYGAGSPVCAVLAGHLHQTWEGNLTDTCLEHVFGAAFEGHIGRITLKGE